VKCGLGFPPQAGSAVDVPSQVGFVRRVLSRGIAARHDGTSLVSRRSVRSLAKRFPGRRLNRGRHKSGMGTLRPRASPDPGEFLGTDLYRESISLLQVER
jgi:hypothetical protein